MYRSLKTNRNFLAIVFLCVSFAACTKKDHPDFPAAGEIAASEQLVSPAAVAVPANLPVGNTRSATFFATGVQKYKARAKEGTPDAFEWVFVAPEAVLYNADNVNIGTHGVGPFWKLVTNDSIYAQPYTPAKTVPSPDANSIDWLLLMPKAGSTPKGIFAGVDYIQRIATKGGKAPATAPVSINDAATVPYTAVYRFTKQN